MADKKGRHPERALTAVSVRQMKKAGRYADGNGLYLIVDPSGAKRWMLRTVVRGRRRDIGLGGTSLVSLAEAREQALELRRIARQGGDPLEHRRRAVAEVPTFGTAAEEVHQQRAGSWRNAKHGAQWINTLRTYVFPDFGARPINELSTPDVLRVLAPIWLTKPETAKRVRQRMGVVFDWAIAAGHMSGANPVAGVTKGLPKQSEGAKHHAALPYAEAPAFMQQLRASTSGLVAKLAFEFLILTAARTSEVLLADWREIDTASRVWTVPAARMKAKREHRVPLSSRAIALLEELRAVSDGSGLIFPGAKAGRPLSNMTFTKMMRSMKVDATAHGFRSTFRDWASEHGRYAVDLAEMALAHVVANKVEAAYRRGDLLEARREMMEAWSISLNLPV